MIIAVNTRFLINENLEGYGYFILETFKRIVAAHPEHLFVFIYDRPYEKDLIEAENVKSMVVGPQARHPLLWSWWFNIRIPSVLKKIKADVFVSPDGFCSLGTKLPQCIVIHDLAFLHFPFFNKKAHLPYLKRNTPKFLKKAKTIATVSMFSKNDIITQYKIEDKKIDVVYNAAKEIFLPLEDERKTTTKNKYTEGREYFIYTGAIHPRKNLINLLKAFSLFKKRMQSNMKLVLVGRLAWMYDSFLNDLKTYKYRQDVIVTGYVDEKELSLLTGSAYAMVYPSFFEGFGVPVLEAMQSKVPVVTSENSSMQEIAGDAALYADPQDPASIAEKMMLLYKDERLKKELTVKGLEVAGRFSWDKTASLLWRSIEKAMG